MKLTLRAHFNSILRRIDGDHMESYYNFEDSNEGTIIKLSLMQIMTGQ